MPRVKTGPVYRLKITRRRTSPPIWRRVLVPGHYTLEKLHEVIQIAMGWTDSHLHLFRIGKTLYGLPNPYSGGWDLEMLDSRPVRLDQIVPEPKTKFMYEYDFGDSWEHDVLVEKILPPDPKLKHPVCLKGQGACPLEDIGGVWGYANFLEAIADPSHPDHAMYTEWVGDEFDPAAFDLEANNAALQRIK